MNQPHAANSETPESLARQLDEIGDRFEAAWLADQRPRIEDYLNDYRDVSRPQLLRELVYLDIACRCRIGQSPRPDDYAAWFHEIDPRGLAEVIAEAQAAATSQRSQAANDTPVEPIVPAATAAANPAQAAAPGSLCCPHCHTQLALGDERSDEMFCPSCGSSVRVRDTRLDTTTAQARPLGKFLCLERIGIGAFGAVWRARDTQLDRLVALKIPHASLLATPADRERFLREARASAQLRHHGIVTIHEVVELDGLPTIVSDFIDGLSLRELLGVRKLTFRESAELVANVAEALHYAHTMGVVHRDIKPANIMIEVPQGEGIGASFDSTSAAHALPTSTVNSSVFRPRPLLCDFGLALRTDADVTMTVEGQIVGTIAYMSPEQAAGASHRVDGRGDVYSLGVVLYELLCGELPFRGTNPMMLYQVRHEEPRPPRRINDKIPRDLETICLKAMGKSPSHRYATARELADDLRRWLRGEPILARPVGSIERLWRWSVRNRELAALAAMLFAAVLAGLISVTALWLRSESQRSLAERERTNAQRNANEAEQQRVAADEERARAEENFRLAQDAVDKYLTQVSLSPDLKSQGLEPLRRQLLQTAQEFYEQFVGQRANDPRLRKDLALASGRLAAIARTLGDFDQAKRAYEKALQVFEQLEREQPGVPEHLDGLAASHLGLGQLFASTGRPDEAEAAVREALAIRKKLAAQTPDEAKHQSNLAATYGTLGNIVYRNPSRFEETEARWRDALGVYENLARDHPNTGDYQNYAATTYSNLGALYERAGRELDALTALVQARDIHEKLVREHPNISDYEIALAGSLNNLAATYSRTGDTEKAKASYERTLAVDQNLARRHPAVPKYRFDWATACKNVGYLFAQTGEFAEAEESYRKAIELLQKLVDDHPAAPDYRRELAASANRLGALYADTDRPHLAEEPYRQAKDIQEGLVRDFPKVAQYQADLANSYYNTGLLFKQSGRREEAVTLYEQAVAIREGLATELPATPEHQRALSVSLNSLATVYREEGKRAEAEAILQRALGIREKLTRGHPSVLQYAIDVGVSLGYMGNHLNDCGNPEGALTWYGNAIEHLEAVLLKQPRNAEAHKFLRENRQSMAVCLAGMGDTALRDCDFARAATFFERALKRLENPRDEAATQDSASDQRRQEWQAQVELCRLAPQAIEDLDFTLKQSPEKVARLLLVRIRHLTLRAQVAEATVTAEKLQEYAVGDPLKLYDTARGFALTAATVGRIAPTLTAIERTERDKLAHRAVEALRDAIAAGFNDFDTMRTDADLEAIRGSEGYESLLNADRAQRPRTHVQP